LRQNALGRVAADIALCRLCPRLVRYRETIARVKRAAFRTELYWGRPIAGFGDPEARIVVVGLAPAAHGANRTGRIFTGDRSGDFLYAALYRAGLASQPESRARGDGLTLYDVFVTCPVRCAPPDNRPSPAELARCAPFFDRELDALGAAKVLVALGAVAWAACLDHLERTGAGVPRPRPKFGHGEERRIGDVVLLGSYHVSQQNTQTGRLTPAMFDRVVARAKALASRA
jgi:uracil-DNA glycosylase family 4